MLGIGARSASCLSRSTNSWAGANGCGCRRSRSVSASIFRCRQRLPVVIGAVIGHWYDGRVARRKDLEYRKRLGVLVASGMIVGESLFGVLLAGLIVIHVPLALVPDDFAPGPTGSGSAPSHF